MLWVKSFHIIFVVAWFAGLFYLPRLFVYHTRVGESEPVAEERFRLMERKLFGIMTVGGAGALAFGLWLLRWWWHAGAGGWWLYAKLALVALLVAFHLWCWTLMRAFRTGNNRHGERFYRIINEAPALLLVAIVLLVVLKPF
jgi:putative membrane protein